MATTIKASTFIEWLKTKVGLGYVYGAIGQIITIDFLKQVERLYGATMGVGYFHLNGDYTKGRCGKWIGKWAADCSGLIKCGRKELTGVWQDFSAQGTYDSCVNKGKLSTMLFPGTALFMYSTTSKRMVHVGIYIGNGQVIEARGADYGIVITKLSARPWTHYGIFSWLVFDLKNDGTLITPDVKQDTDAGDNSDIKVDDPPVTLVHSPTIDTAFKGGLINSPDYWESVIQGRTLPSPANIKSLIDKANLLINK